MNTSSAPSPLFGGPGVVPAPVVGLGFSAIPTPVIPTTQVFDILPGSVTGGVGGGSGLRMKHKLTTPGLQTRLDGGDGEFIY